MSQNGWIAVIVGILIIAAGAWWFTTSNPTGDANLIPAPQDTTSGTGGQLGGEVTVAPMSAVITYNGTSFAPQEVTIGKGGTVKWVNASTGNMWVASAQHPTHTAYSGTTRTQHCPDTAGTAFDQCVGGGDYSFTFAKTGTWGYHDHLNASAFGRVVVTE